MSFANLIKDIVTGNFTNAEARIKDWWSGVSPAIQAFITTVETDEGKILQGLVATAAQDVIKGGFSTASFVAAAADVGAKLLSQNITMLQTVIFAALNAEVGTQASAAGVAAPTNAGPAVVAPVAVALDPTATA